MKTDQFQIFETSHKTKAGRSFPVEVCSSLIIFQGKPAILSIARDITERKQAEDALRQSEDKFKYIFDHSVVGKSITFPSGEIQVNQAFCDMLGYSYEELQGPKWQDITHPDDIELTQKEIDSILLGEKESARFVKRYIHKNGSVVWVDVGTSLRRDGAGKPLYFMTTVSDISIRMQALHDFKASETRYRRLFESAKDGILILNAEAGLVIDVNPFMIEMLGYAREDFIGKHLWDIGPFKDIAACRDMFFELQKTSYMRYEDLPLATRNGRQIYVEFISIVYSVDNMSVIQCYIRDITDRIHAEEALDREQRLLKVLMDNIPDHIYFKDVNSRFLTINRSLAESFHLSDPDQVAGKTDFDFFTEEHAIQAYNDEQKIIKTGKPVIGIEEKETWSRYEPTWVSTTKMPLIDKDGNIIGTFGISRDITERKLAEEQIKKNLKEKEILIRELYHRTKNNMQVISSILRLRARSLKNTQLIKAFKEIESKILSMALVHQKLYESQDLSQLNLKNYIISLIALIKQLYSEFMSHITIHSNMKDIFVLIDTATPLGLVVNELITNAILHAFPNGRRGEIQVNLDVSRGNAFVLEISDNGIGLPESFDSEKNIHLGLQTVFDLIEEQLNGKIRFKNQNGLHFHLTIHQELYQARI
jgi:PAS domain S-box-containing protein